MNRKERFAAAVEGRETDRPPVTAWVHFHSEHLSGEDTAQLHLKFLREYEWDVAKVMNDYRYPAPAGLEQLDSADAMRQFRRLSLDAPSFTRQLATIRTMRRELGPDWPILDTLFAPYLQVLLSVGPANAGAIPQHHDAALEMLDVVTETLCNYVAASREAGADGFFMSVNGAIPDTLPLGVSDAVFREFQRPFDLRVLEAAQGATRVLHAHGAGLHIDRVLDYPCEVLSLADRQTGNPSLAQLRQHTDKCLMGGIDEARIQNRLLPELRTEVDDAIAQAGRQRLILSPGCTVPSFTSQRTLHCLSQHARRL